MKKQLNDRGIASIQFVIAFISSVVLTFLAVLIVGFILVGFLSVNTSFMVVCIFSILSIWIGVRVAANYICRNYTIGNSDKIIKISTLHYAIFAFGWSLLQLKHMYNPLSRGSVWVVLMGVIIFYVAGKKYIKNDDVIATQQ